MKPTKKLTLAQLKDACENGSCLDAIVELCDEYIKIMWCDSEDEQNYLCTLCLDEFNLVEIETKIEFDSEGTYISLETIEFKF